MSLDEKLRKLESEGIILLGEFMLNHSLYFCLYPTHEKECLDWMKYTYIPPLQLEQYVDSLLDELK